MTWSRWSQQQISEAERLWAEGKSSGVIAHAMGRSRNAVIGVLHRRGLTGDKRETKEALPRPKSSNFRAYKGVVEIKLPRPRQPPAVAPGARLAALALEPLAAGPIVDAGCCKYISGEPGRACGRPAIGPWCPEHRNVVYVRREAA